MRRVILIFILMMFAYGFGSFSSKPDCETTVRLTDGRWKTELDYLPQKDKVNLNECIKKLGNIDEKFKMWGHFRVNILDEKKEVEEAYLVLIELFDKSTFNTGAALYITGWLYRPVKKEMRKLEYKGNNNYTYDRIINNKPTVVDMNSDGVNEVLIDHVYYKNSTTSITSELMWFNNWEIKVITETESYYGCDSKDDCEYSMFYYIFDPSIDSVFGVIDLVEFKVMYNKYVSSNQVIRSKNYNFNSQNQLMEK